MNAMDLQIAAFEDMLPQVRRKHGAVWVLVAHQKLIQTFTDFSAAAQYAIDHLNDEQVLIRHTDAPVMETVPFIRIAC